MQYNFGACGAAPWGRDRPGAAIANRMRIPALGPRVLEPEILDSLPPDEAAPSLADIVRINRYLGGHEVLRGLLRRAGAAERFSLLDVGAASGDMAAIVRQDHPQARVTLLDHVAAHLPAAGDRVCADAFRMPFPDASFDYVYCSLFLHHFEDPAVTLLLREFGRLARRAVLVSDLLRHPLAYWFLPATKWLLRWHPVTVHDGRISVAAAFRAAELANLAGQAGLEVLAARSHVPAFRVSLIARARERGERVHTRRPGGV